MTASAMSAVLLADFHELLSDLNIHQFDLPASAATLRRDLRLAVRSSLGFTVTVQGRLQLPVFMHVIDQPLQLTEVPTSLRLSFSALAPDVSDTTITIYADRPGALVDLAADLTRALELPLEAAVLDVPQPSELICPGLVGLVEFNLVSQAVGVLIAQGLSGEEARLTLHRDLDRVATVHAAQELLTQVQATEVPAATTSNRFEEPADGEQS